MQKSNILIEAEAFVWLSLSRRDRVWAEEKKCLFFAEPSPSPPQKRRRLKLIQIYHSRFWMLLECRRQISFRGGSSVRRRQNLFLFAGLFRIKTLHIFSSSAKNKRFSEQTWRRRLIRTPKQSRNISCFFHLFTATKTESDDRLNFISLQWSMPSNFITL